MAGFLDHFRRNVVASLKKENFSLAAATEVNDKIALGVLLWMVAQADKKFLPQEKENIRKILKDYALVPETEIPLVMTSVEQAAQESIDLFTFTHEISGGLSYTKKREIVEHLFRVACVDGELAHEEHETIRKIAGLFRLDHKDFIDAKIKIKKQFGIETV